LYPGRGSQQDTIWRNESKTLPHVTLLPEPPKNAVIGLLLKARPRFPTAVDVLDAVEEDAAVLEEAIMVLEEDAAVLEEATVVLEEDAAVLIVVDEALVMTATSVVETAGWAAAETDVAVTTELVDELAVTKSAPLTALLGLVYPTVDLR
jgi:hypothetical protein